MITNTTHATEEKGRDSHPYHFVCAFKSVIHLNLHWFSIYLSRRDYCYTFVSLRFLHVCNICLLLVKYWLVYLQDCLTFNNLTKGKISLQHLNYILYGNRDAECSALSPTLFSQCFTNVQQQWHDKIRKYSLSTYSCFPAKCTQHSRCTATTGLKVRWLN